MKTKTWMWLAVAALSFLIPREVEGSGACMAARFHFWQNMGCNVNYAGAGGPPTSQSNAGGNNAQCGGGCGMPVWSVSEPYINLNLLDEPLSYTMSSGQKMSFRFYYRQTYSMPAASDIPDFAGTCGSPYVSRLGNDSYASLAHFGGMANATWANSWMMDIIFWDTNYDTRVCNNALGAYQAYSSGYQALVFRPEGGLQYFYTNGSQNALRDQRSQATLVPQSASGYPTVSLQSADTNGIYWGNTNDGFRLVYPDGSRDIFGFTTRGTIFNGSSTYRALLSQRIDPQGRTTRIGYELAQNLNYSHNYAISGPRVRYVIDPDGRTNIFLYATNNPNYSQPPIQNPWMLTEIDDPYGRRVQLGYAVLMDISTGPTAVNVGILTSITDAAGLTSSFQYQAPAVTYSNLVYGDCPGGSCWSYTNGLGFNNGWITNLTTPYGTTSFSYYQVVPDTNAPDEFSQRAIYISEPAGAQQLYYYLHKGDDASGNPLLPQTAQAPTVPGVTNFDDGKSGNTHPSLDYRNTIYWGRRQSTALSSNVLASLPTNLSNALANLNASDFRKGRVRNWLWQSDAASISECLSSEREPSPDAAGQIEDTNRIWYSYPGQPSPTPELAGNNPNPSCIATLLPDGTSQYTTYNYYPITGVPGFPAGAGMVSDNESSYTKPDGSIGALTNWFSYSGNNIDLLSITNSAGQHVNLGHNSYHQIIAVTNALSQVTSLSWDVGGTWNLTGIQMPDGQSVSLSYYWTSPSNLLTNMLQQISISPEGRTFTINNYSASLPSSITDDRGLTVTNTWDGLNRLTSTRFPDTTTISNIYSRLDLVAAKDRLSNWTYFAYDGLQHLTSVTNANNAVTYYSYCGCGSLNEIIDAQNGISHPTYFNYDNQGNLTNVSFPDSSSLNWQYDPVGRATKVFDSLNRSLQVAYNNQGLTTNIASANGTLQSASFDALNRPIIVTDANGVTTTNTFDAINELTKRTWPDGISEGYGYSAAGMVAYTNRDGKATFYGLDSAGRVTSVTNANNEVVRAAYDSLDNITNLWDGNTNQTRWQYDQYGWLTNKIDGLGRNAFRYSYNPNGWVTNRWTPEKGNTGYSYDNVGNLRAISYPSSSISYLYDALNRLTNMADTLGSHTFTWTPASQLAGESDAWTTVNSTNVQGLRTAMSIVQSGGNWTQTYGYDSAWRMTNTVSAAGAFGYQFLTPNSHLLTSISLPNGAKIVNGYDSLARLKETDLNNYWNHTLDGYGYQRDPLGLATNITRNFGLTTNSVSVGYDNIAQVTNWTAKEFSGVSRQNEQLGFGYDAAHNLRTRVNGNLTQTFTLDAANELTNVARTGTYTLTGATPAPTTGVTVNGQPAQTYSDLTFARTNLALTNGVNTFTVIATNAYGVVTTNIATVNLPLNVALYFDNNGSLTNDGAKLLFYDSENQLTNATAVGQWKVEFVYDGLNRKRIERDYVWQSSSWVRTNETHFIYDGYLLVQERDSNNIPQVIYTRGLDLSGTLSYAGGIGGLLARSDSGGSLFFHSDGSMNVTVLTDSSENIPGRYGYMPFGDLFGIWGAKAPSNLMRFSGKQFEPSLGDYDYGSRHYWPRGQRWLTTDPAGELFGFNLYESFFNAPTAFADRDGRDNMWNMGAGNNAPPVSASSLLPGANNNSSTAAYNPPQLWPGNPNAPAYSAGYSVVQYQAFNDLMGNGSILTPGQAAAVATPISFFLPFPGLKGAVKCPSVAEDSVAAFRAVSDAELNDISKFGFRPDPKGKSMLDKWFSETRQGAEQYRLYYSDLEHIVEADVPRSVYNQSYRHLNIDGTGPGFAVPQDLLPLVKPK